MKAKREEKKAEEKRGSGIMEVVFILDRSGSMSGLEEDTIGGFNSMLERQKKGKGNIIWSTILFDDAVEKIHDRMPIKQVKRLTGRQYYVRGCTALLDAVGGAIKETVRVHRNTKKEFVPEKTLFVITTDGLENSSMEYTYAEVKRMITHEQKKHGWEFVFLGANIDAAKEAGRIGICANHSAEFMHDGGGVEMNYMATSVIMDKMARMEAIDGSELDCVREDYERRVK